METMVSAEKLDSVIEMVAKNSEDITGLIFKLDDVRMKVVGIEVKVGAIEKTLENKADKADVARLEQKFDNLEKKVDQTGEKLDTLEKKVDQMGEKIGSIEEKLDLVVKKLS